MNDEVYLECEDCHKSKVDVHITTCPYADEINDETIEIMVCNDCYQQRLWDI